MIKLTKPPALSTAPAQLDLGLSIAAEREVDGIGMGVLKNGTPFLTLRGLARMCGVDHTLIVRITSAWQDQPAKPREQKIKELVRAAGSDDSVGFIAIPQAGTIYHAVPAAVCMAILEYYAFEATGAYAQAAKSFRLLARKGFQDFVYSQVGWNPSGSVDIAWRQFHDRVSLSFHTVPDGYFSVFKEVADLQVTLLRQGAALGSNFIPDISIGLAWSKYWGSEGLADIHGERVRYEHNYPSYFPQSASNPQQPYCYPDDALGEFRRWIKEDYVPNQMPTYLKGKVRDKAISPAAAQAALTAFRPRALSSK